MTGAGDDLTVDQLNKFCRDGVLVVEGLLSKEEVESACQGLHRTLLECGVDPDDLATTGHHLAKLSSTGGSGGVLDLFYDTDWKLPVATHPKLFRWTKQLWKTAYCHNGEEKANLSQGDQWKWHPYGTLDLSKGYSYIDRIGYRLPTRIAEDIGARMSQDASSNHSIKDKKNKKSVPIQRSLTPHLDCCPEDLFADSKWRPIQCFVSLTDNILPNTGGFEAAESFHIDFEEWARQRPPTVITRKNKQTQATETVSFPAPCLGEYTHIRPTEDAAVMKRVQHVAVTAGSVVFWDNRIPHANSYKHLGEIPRAVVYTSFLPDVPLNRKYVAKQLAQWRQGRQPTDQWVKSGEEDDILTSDDEQKFTQEQRKLLGIEPW